MKQQDSSLLRSGIRLTAKRRHRCMEKECLQETRPTHHPKLPSCSIYCTIIIVVMCMIIPNIRYDNKLHNILITFKHNSYLDIQQFTQASKNQSPGESPIADGTSLFQLQDTTLVACIASWWTKIATRTKLGHGNSCDVNHYIWWNKIKIPRKR